MKTGFSQRSAALSVEEHSKMKPSCLVLVCFLLLVSQISCQRRGYGGRRTHQDIDREESLVSLMKYLSCKHLASFCILFYSAKASISSILRNDTQIDLIVKID